jgi:cell division protein FtsB
MYFLSKIKFKYSASLIKYMKERGEKGGPKAKKSKLVLILISIIVVLALILGFGIYSGIKIKSEIDKLNIENQQLNSDKADLTSKLDTLQKNYDLLYNDVQNVYKTCPTENACKGHFPEVSWYCNNLGDEVSDPSHICVCDVSCNMKATPIIK